MKGFVAVARREFDEHRMILWAAIAGGVLAALVGTMIRGRDVRELAATFVGVSFAAGLAIALGSSAMAGPLAQRRLGFHFVRPLSSAAIWWGKLAGVAALVLAAEALGSLPGIAANGFAASREAVGVLFAGLGLSLLVLLPLAHAVGIAVRSRSRWLALDFAGVTLLVIAAVLGSRLLVRELALTPLNMGLAVLAVLAIAALLAGGFAGVSRGRTDLERTHGALSAVLWSVMLPASALWLGYSIWITSPRVGDLTRIGWASPAPRGELAAVVGKTRWRGEEQSRFLVDLSTGRGVRLPSSMIEPLFSADGRRAVTIEPQYVPRGLSVFAGTFGGIQTEGAEVYQFERETGSIRRRDTGISVSAWPDAAALSADGSRLAVVSSEHGTSTVSVHEVSSGRLLGAAPIANANRFYVFFPRLDRVRVYSDDATTKRAGELRVLEFDLAARRIEALGQGAPAAEYRFIRLNAAATRLLLTSRSRVALADAASAAEIAVLSSGARWSRHATFLANGRIAVAEGDAGGIRVRLFSPEGIEQKSISVAPPGRIAVGPQPTSGTLLVSRRTEKEDWSDSESLLVDLAAASVRSLGRHMVPAGVAWTGGRLDAGSTGSKLFLDSAGRLLEVNPETGERRVLLPKR